MAHHAAPAAAAMVSGLAKAVVRAANATSGAARGARLADCVTREVVDDIFAHALKKQTGVSLKYMLDFGANPIERQLLLSAQFLHKELRVRLAHRVAELENLPYGLSTKAQILKASMGLLTPPRAPCALASGGASQLERGGRCCRRRDQQSPNRRRLRRCTLIPPALRPKGGNDAISPATPQLCDHGRLPGRLGLIVAWPPNPAAGARLVRGVVQGAARLPQHQVGGRRGQVHRTTAPHLQGRRGRRAGVVHGAPPPPLEAAAQRRPPTSQPAARPARPPGCTPLVAPPPPTSPLPRQSPPSPHLAGATPTWCP
jgi:hypothetical protein